MSGKVFYGIIVLLGIGVIFFAVVQKKPETERPGVTHQDNGRDHVQAKEYGGVEPPTSGPHTQPLPWRAYDQEIPDSNTIHNMEHGGVYISYKPDLPTEQVEKLKALFFNPFSKDTFTPSKAIMAPRPTNDSAIIVSSWTRSIKLNSFDEQKLIEYYIKNVGKSPEPGAS